MKRLMASNRFNSLFRLLVLCGGLAIVLMIVYLVESRQPEANPKQQIPTPSDPPSPVSVAATPQHARHVIIDKNDKRRHMVSWWAGIPQGVRESLTPTGKRSNIRPADYSGPESCRECHKDKFESWSNHSHRWMNALADESSVRGDFSGATISYLGGVATFYKDADRYYRMRLERDGTRRVYAVNQTIGSRFTQYYVGKLIEGPEPKDHRFYKEDHVLHFGYWLEKRQWVPVVHIGNEKPDGQRADPFDPPDSGEHFARYATACNYCHTTFSMGDMFLRRSMQIARHVPVPLHLSMTPYLTESHSEMMASIDDPNRTTEKQLMNILVQLKSFEAPDHAVALGISCEACHLGCKDHAEEGKAVMPMFFPSSPHLYADTRAHEITFDRSHANVNWVCSRCHAGRRPQYANGVSTWNSTEYTDAMLGSCYTKLRCTDCHDPHVSTGPKWSNSPDQDDQKCIDCHKQFDPPKARLAHTHHPAGSEGARCMNCHMPRLNEGLQDMVRTHTIFSPTNRVMLEENHPNACNMCHTEKSIDWTLAHLKDWYDITYSDGKIADSYPERQQATALGWLKSGNEAVRLVGADVLCRTNATWATKELIDALDDPFLINRQIAGKRLEKLHDIRLTDFGYRFYMTPEERRKPLTKLRTVLLQKQAGKANPR